MVDVDSVKPHDESESPEDLLGIVRDVGSIT